MAVANSLLVFPLGSKNLQSAPLSTRRVIENAFGTLAARWRVFIQPIQSAVEKTDRIVKATISLHNFLRQTNSAGYCPTGFVDSYYETGTIKEENGGV